MLKLQKSAHILVKKSRLTAWSPFFIEGQPNKRTRAIAPVETRVDGIVRCLSLSWKRLMLVISGRTSTCHGPKSERNGSTLECPITPAYSRWYYAPVGWLVRPMLTSFISDYVHKHSQNLRFGLMRPPSVQVQRSKVLKRAGTAWIRAIGSASLST